MNELLTEENFLIYAAKYYENSQCVTTEEFLEDLTRIKYIKKLITRYVENNDLKEKLILNHLIVLNNVFPSDVLCRLLYLKLKKYFNIIKPFLLLLGILPDRLYNINSEKIIETDMISIDQHIVNLLRKI
jgi:hypothetical protein